MRKSPETGPDSAERLKPPFDLMQFLYEHCNEALVTRVAERFRPMIEGMMDAGKLHRQALFMHVGLARPEWGRPWFWTIHTEIFGKQPRDKWEHPYDVIAPDKNSISGRTRQLSRVIQNGRPKELTEEDTEYWGNWMMWPLLVAFSGVKPWYDMAISGGIGMMIVAELEQILHDVYGLTAEDVGLVTFDNTTLPVFTAFEPRYNVDFPGGDFDDS